MVNVIETGIHPFVCPRVVSDLASTSPSASHPVFLSSEDGTLPYCAIMQELENHLPLQGFPQHFQTPARNVWYVLLAPLGKISNTNNKIILPLPSTLQHIFKDFTSFNSHNNPVTYMVISQRRKLKVSNLTSITHQ